MTGGGQRFRFKSAYDAVTRAHVAVQVARCCRCGREASIHDSTAGGMAISGMAERFRRKGWRIGARRTADECPACVGVKAASPAKPLTASQKRAAFCRIADVPRAAPAKPSIVPKPKEAVMPPKTTPAPTLAVVASAAEPPRQPTREDRRKIREALDACYLTDKGVYVGDGCDKALAEKLGVPRAWLAAERDAAYGPDACEDDGADLKAVEALTGRVADIETRAMAVAEEAEAARVELRKLHDRLAKRGAA